VFFHDKLEMKMNTRKITQEYRLAHWAGIVRDRIESGLNIREFCDREGICENTYYYWQRKLRESACEEMLPALRSGDAPATAPGGWTAVTETKGVSASAEQTLPVAIGNYRISVSRNTSGELLAKVCRVLASL
jgi:putative transposase